MTNEKILTKAIGKALKNGWEIPERFDTPWEVVELGDESVILEYGDSFVMLELSMPEIVFSHDFAKAFFGFRDSKSISSYYDGSGKKLEDWEYHLQQMVLCENPLQYLQKFMEANNV